MSRFGGVAAVAVMLGAVLATGSAAAASPTGSVSVEGAPRTASIVAQWSNRSVSAIFGGTAVEFQNHTPGGRNQVTGTCAAVATDAVANVWIDCWLHDRTKDTAEFFGTGAGTFEAAVATGSVPLTVGHEYELCLQVMLDELDGTHSVSFVRCSPLA